MATKKTTAKTAPKKKTPAKKSAETKKTVASTTKTTVKTTAHAPESETLNAPTDTVKKKSLLPKNLINIVLAEVVGTFILTIVAIALTTELAPLYVGLTLAVIALMIGGVSGAHVNPAVTFGLWTMRKLKTALVPFYWTAQFLGAMAAVVLVGTLSTSGVEGTTGFAVDFSHFMNFSWGIFFLELIGMAIFMFGISAAISRTKLMPAATAAGIGAALTIALLATTALHPYIRKTTVERYQHEQSQPGNTQTQDEAKNRTRLHSLYVGGATLNPALAMAVTEKTDAQVLGATASPDAKEKLYSRLSLEVVLATLIGAALGGNLFLLVNYRTKTEE